MKSPDRLLIVDDVPDNLFLVRTILEEEGYEVVGETGRGDEAVALVRELQPEIAILDVFATEPLPVDSRFWDHPRVVVSPHSSGGGDGRIQRAVDVFAENLQRWQRGGQLLHEITESDLPAQPETWVSEKR